MEGSDAVRKLLILLIGLAVAVSGALPAACAEPGGVERFFGTWVGDGVRVELRREAGELLCRALFQEGDGRRETWQYCACGYDAAEDAVECFGIIRTYEEYSRLFEDWVETDWAMDDLCFARLEWSAADAGPVWHADGLDAPVALRRPEDAGQDAGPNATIDE